jgi:hypothetical protein
MNKAAQTAREISIEYTTIPLPANVTPGNRQEMAVE